MVSLVSMIRSTASLCSVFALSIVTHAAGEKDSVLVAGHGTGKIQSFEPGQPAAPARVFAEALPALNAMVEASDGFLLVSTGAPAQAGTITRIDPATGIPTGTFWEGPTPDGKAIGRLTGLALADGILYAAEGDAGVIHALDALTGEWQGVAARSEGAVISQIFLGKEGLLAADFAGQQILLFSRGADKQLKPDATVLHSTAPASPWGVVANAGGRIFYSTSMDEVVQLDKGNITPWISGEKARQVIYLGLSRDGSLLVPSNATGSVSAWSTEKAVALWERQLPPEDQVISLLQPSGSTAAMQSLLFRQEGVPGAEPTVAISVKAFADRGLITHLGWDTEGGGREINNLLRGPLRFSMIKGGQTTPLAIESLTGSEKTIGGKLVQEAGTPIGTFEITFSESNLTFSGKLEGAKTGADAQVSLTLDLNPRMCATSFHASKWTTADTGNLPGVMIAPDMGSMEVTSANPTEVRFTGDRPRRETTLAFTSATGSSPALAVQMAPLHLKNPTPGSSEELWKKARRGWWNLPLGTSNWGGATDGTSGSLAGVWGNNVISNPVGATLFWLADHIVLAPEWSKSVDGSDFLRHTVEYHLTHKILPEGDVAYVDQQGGAMDANPALVIAFWGVVESTGDLEWMKTWLPKLAPAIAFLNSRDVDGDGLIESKQSGNAGTGAFGDTAWDTYSSGHKNAYVNALAHRAYKCLEALSIKNNDAPAAADYGQRAAKLKSAFRTTFYNPETGWLAWWKSADGELHDVHSDVPTSLATVCGLLDPADAKVMLDKYWTALQSSGFDNFALGVPLNYRPVPAALQFAGWGGSKPDGSETFQKYLNGACTVSNTMWFLVANYIIGDDARADGILEKMVDRQHVGVFPNGGGFQNGVVDIYPHGAEFFDWKGNTCGYEGHLVYSWTFLQAIPLRDKATRDKLYGFLQTDATTAAKADR